MLEAVSWNLSDKAILRGVIRTQDGRIIHVVFENVLLVPELAINLLSVERIIAKGGKVVFNEPNA